MLEIDVSNITKMAAKDEVSNKVNNIYLHRICPRDGVPYNSFLIGRLLLNGIFLTNSKSDFDFGINVVNCT